MSDQTQQLTKPAMQRLEAWMMEITDCLCYQPEIPLAHKTELVNALKSFQKEINHPMTVIQGDGVTCPKCGNYYGGHATGGWDICCCHETQNH